MRGKLGKDVPDLSFSEENANMFSNVETSEINLPHLLYVQRQPTSK